jgi:hypothetical protein
MSQEHDIVPTLRMFDGLLMNKAADEIERLRSLFRTPNASLPPLGEGPRRKLLVTIEVPVNWESRLDMQWVVEREIAADRWAWNWPAAVPQALTPERIEELFQEAAGADEDTHIRFARAIEAELRTSTAGAA